VSYTANNLDQYTAVAAVTPTYDGNGNLTYDGIFTYGYDAESRLISVTQGSTTVAAYAYDVRDRCARQVVDRFSRSKQKSTPEPMSTPGSAVRGSKNLESSRCPQPK
jgi:YD repeat-containing protein